jgi:transcriptional regulator with XRE-family HTH domain
MTIKQYLDKTCIKHCAFAKRCGLEKSAFSRYVNGSRTPSAEIYKRIKKESNNKITQFDHLL